MFFTNLGRVVAWMIFAYSFAIGTTGFVLAINASDPRIAQIYFPGKTTGDVIEQSIHGFGIAIALGILTEISRNVLSARKSE